VRYFKFLRGTKDNENSEMVSCALPTHLWDAAKFILNDLYNLKTRPTRLYVFENDYVELIRTWISADNHRQHSQIQIRHNEDIYNFFYKEGIHIDYVMYMYEIN